MKYEKTIAIPEKEYEQLLKDSEFLQALREAGVDNWEGYSQAMQIIDDYEFIEEVNNLFAPL